MSKIIWIALIAALLVNDIYHHKHVWVVIWSFFLTIEILWFIKDQAGGSQ